MNESPNELTTRLKPRSFWTTFLVFFIICGAPFTILFTFFFAQTEGFGFFYLFRKVWLLLMIGYGVSMGLFFASFMRSVTREVECRDRQTFISNLNTVATKLGYIKEYESEDTLILRTSMLPRITGGRILVEIKDGIATIVGPTTAVWRLKRRLSL